MLHHKNATSCDESWVWFAAVVYKYVYCARLPHRTDTDAVTIASGGNGVSIVVAVAVIVGVDIVRFVAPVFDMLF